MMEKNLNERICIIGGGPAGISLGMWLDEKGYTNYTILEKLDHVGGKCNSPYYKGKRYEMGAIMGVPGYHAVEECMAHYGGVADGPRLAREFRTSDGRNLGQYPFPKIKGLGVKKQIKKFGSILETKYKGYDKNNHLNTNPDLMMPFDDFIRLNGVEKVKKIWINPYTAFGYGFMENVPAAYVMQYLDFPTTMSFVKTDLWTWKDGTQAIWERLNEKIARPVRLNSDISKIERRDGKVYVTVNGAVEEYDKLVVTAPLDGFLAYADADDFEKEHFSKIIHSNYQVFACLVEKYPGISGYIQDNMASSRLGHVMVYYHRWADEPDQVITAYALGNSNNPGDPVIPLEETRGLVLEDMKTQGFPVREIINECEWYYFPHISSADYKSGWYDRVEARQGQRNTYYAGEVLSFGDMDETCQYSKALAERFF